jgi:hypothetical protein
MIDETALSDIVALNQIDKPTTLEQLVDTSIARDKVNGASTHKQLPLTSQVVTNSTDLLKNTNNSAKEA